MRLAFGVKITLLNVLYSNSNIGLYNDGTHSYFRWITQNTDNTFTANEDWKAGIFLKKWIGNFGQSIDLRRTGNVGIISGGRVSIGNEDRFWATIEALGINLQGFKLEVISFDLDNISSSNEFNMRRLYTGICNQPSYNDISYNISFKTNYEARDVLIGNVINSKSEVDAQNGSELVEGDHIGKIIPVSFGYSEKKRFAKLANRVKNFPSFLLDAGIGLATYDNFIATAYSVVDKIMDLKLSPFSAVVNATITGELDPRILKNEVFVRVIKGDADGEVRRVTSVSIKDTSTITVGLENAFKVNPKILAESGQTWVEIIYINKHFYQDIWPCEYASPHRVFTSDNSEFSEIAPDPLNQNTALDGVNTTLVFSPTNLDESLDKVSGFHVYPLSDGQNYKANDADQIFDLSDTPNQHIGADSSVWYGGDVTNISSLLSATNVLGFESDKLKSNDYGVIVATDLGSESFVSIPMQFKTPKILDDLKGIEGIYILFNITFDWSDIDQYVLDSSPCRLQASVRGWSGFADQNIDVSQSEVKKPREWNNIPDFWGGDFALDNAFYSSDQQLQYDITGYSDFDTGIKSLKEFNALTNIYLNVLTKRDGDNGGFVVKFKQALIGVKTSNQIKDSLFCNGAGRVWEKQTGTSGIVAPNFNFGLIDNPMKILEYVKFLNNYDQEANVFTPDESWGLGYPLDANGAISQLSDLPIIYNGSGVGSFLHSDLSDWGGLNIENSILEKEKATTSKISESICQNFFLATWVNSEGKEAVSQYTRKSQYTPTKVINLFDIVPNSLRGTSEQDSRDIFSAPSINYNKNALGKFENSIEITNTSLDLQTDQEKVDSIKGNHELPDYACIELWEKSRSLYIKYGTLQTPPKNMVDNEWVNKSTGALWFLREWLSSMGAIYSNGEYKVKPKETIAFKVPYSVAMADSNGERWGLGTRLLVNFPNETNNIDREIFISSIDFNISGDSPIVSIKAIMYSIESDLDTGYNDTYDGLALSDQDTYNGVGTLTEDTYNG